MQQVWGHNRYHEGRDLPNVRFNTDSPEFNAWKTERPRSMDPAREDGPLSLGRYDGRGGPPTSGGTKNNEAFKAYLLGEHHRNRGDNEEAVRSAITAYSKALARDPEYAKAYVGFAKS